MQIKRLDATQDAGQLRDRVSANVRDAIEKFDKPLRFGESESNWRTMSDGTKVKSVLEAPEGLMIHIEVPGFEKLPANLQAELNQLAADRVSAYNDHVAGYHEGLPTSVRVVGVPPKR